MGRKIDIAGKRFGRLIAVERVDYRRYPSGGGLSIWRCVCDCGNIVDVTLCALKNNNTKSCGCLQKEIVGKINYKHGQSHTRLNEVWKRMKARCENPNIKEYKWYGGMGVKVCKEWLYSYEKFRDWMLAHGYDENAPRGQCTIDRIDPFGNYEPSNCRVVNMDIQLKNRRSDYENNTRRYKATNQ